MRAHVLGLSFDFLFISFPFVCPAQCFRFMVRIVIVRKRGSGETSGGVAAKDFAHFPREYLQCERLLQKGGTRLQSAFVDDGVLGVA
jgi:hypothetical protein